jgi:hypothetical protein
MSVLAWESLDALVTAVQDLKAGVDNLAAATREQTLCCDSLSGVPYYPPDYDPTENPETSIFCDQVHSYVANYIQAASEYISNANSGQEMGIGGVALIVAAIYLPIGIIAGLVALALTFVLEITESEMLLAIQNMYDDLVCAIWLAGDAESARAAMIAVIEGRELTFAWGNDATDALSKCIQPEALNLVFTETYPVLASKSGSTCDCTDCDLTPLKTHPASPYNTMDCGINVADGYEDSAANGWRWASPSTNWVSWDFVPNEDIAHVNVSFWYRSPHPSSWSVGVLRLYRTDPWSEVAFLWADLRGTDDAWTYKEAFNIPAAMLSGQNYRARAQDAGGNDGWIRDLVITVVD